METRCKGFDAILANEDGSFIKHCSSEFMHSDVNPLSTVLQVASKLNDFTCKAQLSYKEADIVVLVMKKPGDHQFIGSIIIKGIAHDFNKSWWNIDMLYILMYSKLAS